MLAPTMPRDAASTIASSRFATPLKTISFAMVTVFIGDDQPGHKEVDAGERTRDHQEGHHAAGALVGAWCADPGHWRGQERARRSRKARGPRICAEFAR